MHFENVNLADLKAISEDDVSIDIRPNEINIARNKFWIAVILEYAVATVFVLFHVSITPKWGITLSMIFLLVLFSVYYTIKEDKESLFVDFDKRLSDDCRFSRSENIPENPPIQEGYVYLRRRGEEFSSAYKTTFSIRGIERDFDMNTVCSCMMTIGKVEIKSGYVYSILEFKRQCLEFLEQNGMEVRAIKNKYGDYVWIRGSFQCRGKMYKIYQKTKLLIFKILLFIACLLPSVLIMASCASAEAASADYVYECKGPKSKVYHTTPDCKGLNRCSTKVVKIQKKATTRRACKICA